MKENQEILLRYLYEQQTFTTSKELARVLNVSVRTIKSYIVELNVLSSAKMISSSNNGYIAHKQIVKDFLNKQQNPLLPQSDYERSIYIIKKLLLDHHRTLNLYDLCEDFYISYSTLKKGIQHMNTAFSNFHVHFIIQNDEVSIKGSEKDKRKLVSHVIYEETENKFVNTNIIKESFDQDVTETILQIIQKTFSQHSYYLNDFANINLLLHLVIIVDRISDGNFIHRNAEEFFIEDIHERSLVMDLCENLEQVFHIKLNSDEQFEIYMLFKTNANYSLPSNQETLNKIVGEKTLLVAKHLVEKVNKYYYINLKSENFLTPFSLHLKNLLARAKNGTYTKNPMTQSIKTACPTVYDIAIYIAIELMEEYKIHINEDEITFLSLHIGAEIERQKLNTEKVKCILLCPDYMKISTSIYNELLIAFSNQMDIVKIITTPEELDNAIFDVCISTIQLDIHLHQEMILIPPFLQQSDKVKIYNSLLRIINNKKNCISKKIFHNFFLEDLFLVNPDLQDKDALIQHQTNKLLELHYVNQNFEENIHIRENAASTAFGCLAIPHTMKMDAHKSCISVCISKQGIKWQQQCVNIVLLVALNRADKRLFHELYETLVKIFSNDTVIELIKECTSFEDFKTIFFESIKAR
ncbi:MAG: BglG family transcription antiterminator [Breznakia sp.]